VAGFVFLAAGTIWLAGVAIQWIVGIIGRLRTTPLTPVSGFFSARLKRA
jgi:hypothetical protein